MDQKKKFKSMYNLGAKSALMTAVIMGAGLFFVFLMEDLLYPTASFSTDISLNIFVYFMAALGQFLKVAVFGAIYTSLFVWLYSKKVFEGIRIKSLYLYGVLIYLIAILIIFTVLIGLAAAMTGNFLMGSIPSIEAWSGLIISVLIYSAIFTYFLKRQMNKEIK